ncbi:MAG: glycine cleavage system protein H [Deltaproteobacteria bacterium]|nr:glycine cleavage system protein H [Deltaproteobacteria bacterium]
MGASYPFPADRWYDRSTHMWACPTPEGEILVGIDLLGLESLGDLAYLTLPAEGTQVSRSRPAGSLEAAKMTGELISPVSGVVTARNTGAEKNPALVNHDPFGQGWMMKIRPDHWEKESKELVGGPDLGVWSQQEILRYKEQGWID